MAEGDTRRRGGEEGGDRDKEPIPRSDRGFLHFTHEQQTGVNIMDMQPGGAGAAAVDPVFVSDRS